MFMMRARFLCTKPEIISDMCIIGNGLVGNSFLASLNARKRLSDLKVVMIGREKRPLDIENLKYNQTVNRVFTLTLSSKIFLDRIGVWDELTNNNSFEVVNRIKVLDSYGGFLKFEDKKLPLQFTVDEKLLDHVINQKTKDLNYDFISEPVESINQDSKYVHIKLKDNSVVKTRLLLACDGANSLTANLIEKEPINYDYNMVAHSMTVQTDFEEKNISIQKFTKDGIFAFLPVGGGNFSLIWCADAETIKDAQNLEDEALIKRINYILQDDCVNKNSPTKNILEKIGNLFYGLYPGKTAGICSENSELSVKSVIPSSRCSFPLSLKMQKSFYSGRVVFVGDSAHRVLPISGHGLNLGLGDVDLLSNLVCSEWIPDEDFPPKFLSGYNRERQLKAATIASMTTILKLIYMSKNEIIGSFTAGGLRLLDLTNPLKKFLIKNARY